MADVIVVGGGPAGCAFAVTARRGGHGVVLLDEHRRLRPWPAESLPAGGGELVSSVFGAGVLDGHVPAFGTAAGWGSGGLDSHDFMAHWAGHGWHLDRESFDAALRSVSRSTGVEVEQARLESLERTAGRWRVNGRWRGDWVVDATGRAGAVASRLGVPMVRLDTQVALVGLVPGVDAEQVTTIEAVRDGWWYALPAPDGRQVVALVTDADLVAGDRSAAWRRLLGEATHVNALVADADLEGIAVGAYPAGPAYRQALIGDGWVAVGDAGVAFDPLSSQGLVTGIVMAAHAATRLDDDGAAGDRDLAAWEADYLRVLDEHLRVRAGFYRDEARWPDSPYWARRRPGSGTAASDWPA